MNGEVITGISFGEFELDTAHRRLLKQGKPVSLKSKTFDLLLTLVQNHGAVLSKNDLLDKVWENQFVEENNLTVHVAALRKALGETKNEHKYIVTVPGKGYCFVAELSRPTNGDIIVESHKFERIVVEEEIVEETSANGFHGRQSLSGRHGWPLWIALPVLLAGAAGVWHAFSSGDGASAQAGTVKIESFSTSGVPHRVAISTDGQTLAYVRRFKGKDSIWIGNIAARSNIQITPDSNRLHESIELSPDGKTIYFVARDANHKERTLMTVPIYGGSARAMIDRVRSFSVSPNGASLAYLRYDEAGKLALYIADGDTAGGEKKIYQPVAPIRFSNHGISWTPDGGSVTVAISGEDGRGCDFAQISLHHGSAARVGQGLCADTSNFAWLKDGSGIVMNGRISPDAGAEVLLANLADNTRRPLTNDSVAYGPYSISTSSDGRIAALQHTSVASVWLKPISNEPGATRILHGSGSIEGNHGLAVAPDRRVLYTLRGANLSSIWDVELDGSSPREIIPAAEGADNVQMNVTPDNRFVVFESNRTGKAEIWRANRDGSKPVIITSGGDNFAPALTPDGQTVLYMSMRSGIYNIWSVDLNGGEPTQLTESGCSWPDVSPDGAAYICATGAPSDGPKRRLNIYPVNGGSEQRSFDVAPNSALYNRPRWAPDGRSIIYKDTVDGLWQQNISGGEPVKLPGFEDERVYHFTFAPDGRLIYSGGVQMREIVILDKPR